MNCAKRRVSFRSTESQIRFEYFLAKELGRSHAELMHSLSAREMLWWQAYYELEAEEQDAAMNEVS